MNFLRGTDLCVKCGLCLPSCPTYQKTLNENESPRGRIALMQAWASGNLPATAALDKHISNCLLCRSCEKVCPASVPYARLVDEYRALNAKLRTDSLVLKLVKSVAHKPGIRSHMQWLLGYYRQSPLADLLRITNIAGILRIKPLERLINTIPMVAGDSEPGSVTSSNLQGRVGLFTGCMGELFDRETLAAAERMLALVGYEVMRPPAQTCCGALDLHSGDRRTAKYLERQNSAAFAYETLDAVVTVASGCGATLQEYCDAGFTANVMDISRFLLQTPTFQKLSFVPLPARILVHMPCSLVNVMHDSQSAWLILQSIPGAELVALPDTIKCCGSAGSFMLEHPDMAQKLLDDILTAVNQHQPHYLATSNIGCALHIRAGLQALNISTEVLHPVVLLNRSLQAPAAQQSVVFAQSSASSAPSGAQV